MYLVEPAHRPSRRAPLVWAIGAAIPWLFLMVAQTVWFVIDGMDGRYGWAHLLLAACTVVGLVVFVFVVPVPRAKIGDFDTELAEVFFEGFARGAECNLHFHLHAGENLHHIVEVCFKAFARALRAATELDPRAAGTMPSTKGQLSG